MCQEFFIFPRGYAEVDCYVIIFKLDLGIHHTFTPLFRKNTCYNAFVFFVKHQKGFKNDILTIKNYYYLLVTNKRSYSIHCKTAYYIIFFLLYQDIQGMHLSFLHCQKYFVFLWIYMWILVKFYFRKYVLCGFISPAKTFVDNIFGRILCR